MSIITTQFDYSRGREIGVGQGRNSLVYLSRDEQHKGEIAVKEIPKASFSDPAQYFNEAELMKTANCQNVVKIFACGTAKDHVVIVMPYCKNGSLQDRIKDGPVQLTETIRIAQGMLAGLGQIHHAARLVHFDVKPSNILFDDNDDVLVSDFGQAQFLNSAGLAAIPRMYMLIIPPEVFTTKHGSVACDVYQAALTIYRTVNGDPFFRDQFSSITNLSALQSAIVGGRFPDRKRYMPHVPKWMRRVLKRAMHVDPSQRFQSTRAFADAFGQDIDLDWEVTVCPSGNIQWDANRKGKASLRVKLTKAPTGWSVSIYRVGSSGKETAKDRSLLWGDSMTYRAAMDHLKRLFESQE